MKLPDAFSADVMAELARPPQIRDPRYAEIVGKDGPKWHVVEVFASAQADVAAELAQRRFGIYVPECDETLIRRGRKINRRVPIFSGYIFVFMWQSDQHWQWIVNTPGVIAIVGELTDAEVDIVRRVENGMRPVIIELPVDVEAEPVRCKSKKKNRWKNRKSAKAKMKRKPITEEDLRNEIITTRAWSAFDDLIQLDSEGRNQSLRKALGLS